MKKYIFFILMAAALSACSSESGGNGGETHWVSPPVTYPATQKVDVVDDYFGTEVADPYRWLESPSDSVPVREWIDAQNEVTFGYLNDIPFRESIRQRLEDIWNYPKYGAPFKRGEHYFFYKNDGLQNQSVLYIQDDLEGEPEVFLDPNTFSSDGTVALTTFSVSKDGKYVAYGTSEGGSDWNEFFVMEVETRKKLDDHLEFIKFSGAAWQGNGFFYGRFPESKGDDLTTANEGKQIFYHKLGDDQSQDKMVFDLPKTPKLSIYAQTTEDERFLVLYVSQGATNDNALYVQDLSKPGSGPKQIIDNFDNSYNVIDNIEDKLLVMTNKDAPRNRLITIDVNNPAQANWTEVIPEKNEVLNGVSQAGGKLFANYMKDASSALFIHELDGTPAGQMDLPGLGTLSGFSGRKEENIAFYTFTSFVYPSTIFQYDIAENKSEVFRQSEIDFDFDAYETYMVKSKSKDGTEVPLFVTHKKGLEKNGQNPCMVYGYGGFNVNLTPRFSISNLVFLENGGVYVQAVLRGGGEYGEDWHKGGMLLNKQNVFDDFISAGEHMIAEGYTSSEKLAISGGSNGGLLVGACMIQRPELFAVAIPRVGVMDMLRYHKFTIGHAWAVEYGDSEDETHFANLYKYSPLHTLKDGVSYPATMVVTADHDDRVVPAHSFKYAARLQEAHAGTDPVLIRIETMAGHGAGKPTSKIIEEAADLWAFVFGNMGVTPIYEEKAAE